MARIDLMDRLDAVLPWVNHADEARQIVGVMARISGAASAAVFCERGGGLHFLAGDPLSEDVVAAINGAWGAQRSRVLTGMVFTESGARAGERVRSRLMWMRRRDEGGLDTVYFAGPDLRPLEACAARLLRLATLLDRLH